MLLDKGIPAGYIFRKVRVELVYVLIIGLIIYYATQQFRHVIPEMPLTIPAFLGTAISVLLSFKLNQSYDRWWEARKVWGSIVNDSRSLVLQLQLFVGEAGKEEIRKIAYRHIGWCYSLGQNLRGLDPIANLEKFLVPDEIRQISLHNNKPLAILQLNTRHIADLRKNGHLDVFSQVQLSNMLINFSNFMGMAERIKSTVFPATYRLFLHAVIYLFVVTLSIALRDIQTYFELPLLVLISSAFFLLERSATHMQDPFSNRPTDTAMTAIATTIEINLKQLLGESDVPKPHQPDEFYLM